MLGKMLEAVPEKKACPALVKQFDELDLVIAGCAPA